VAGVDSNIIRALRSGKLFNPAQHPDPHGDALSGDLGTPDDFVQSKWPLPQRVLDLLSKRKQVTSK
jgi:hypothetical protein